MQYPQSLPTTAYLKRFPAMLLLLQTFLLALSFLLSFPAAGDRELPAPELAGRWQQHKVDIKDFLVSEKLDGVRARWDGRRLLSRSGRVIPAPIWFVKDFPAVALEGELWGGYHSFDTASLLARGLGEADSWRQLGFYLFDAPGLKMAFAERYQTFKQYHQLTPYLYVIEQRRLNSTQELHLWLQQVVAKGGEGLMAHRIDAMYLAGRSDALLKLKPVEDAEARVLAILPGKGKYQGMMGALLVETEAGVSFRLGTGFTDAERASPPLPGTWVTFAFSGLTSGGKPRFARFLRVRSDYRLSFPAEAIEAKVSAADPDAERNPAVSANKEP
ncbi:DNA ligase [Shewanella algae]|uniref:DNA ligase n=1 Tax=Shewanella algae TaxID=38313 RepID=UPI003AAE72B2